MQVEDLEDGTGFPQLVTSVEHVPVEYMTCLGIIVGGMNENKKSNDLKAGLHQAFAFASPVDTNDG